MIYNATDYRDFYFRASGAHFEFEYPSANMPILSEKWSSVWAHALALVPVLVLVLALALALALVPALPLPLALPLQLLHANRMVTAR